MRRRLLAVGLLMVALGAVTATGAFTGGDEVAPAVYLNPAPTSEGAEYVSYDGSGTLQVEITGLNDDAVTDFHGVFNVSATVETNVWVEHDAEGVTLYRSDTGDSIEGQARAVHFLPNETVPVGIRADSRAGDVSLSTLEIHATRETPTPTAEQPTTEPSGPTGTGPDPTDSPGTDPVLTETPATDPGPMDSPADPSGTATPTQVPGGASGSGITPGADPGDTASPTGTPEDAIEVGGFPPWLLALVLLALAALVGLLAIWRRRSGPSITFRVAADGPLAVAVGTTGGDLEAVVSEDGRRVRLRGERIGTAATTEDGGTIHGAVTLRNAGTEPVTVAGRVASGPLKGLSVLADGTGGTDLLATGRILEPGASVSVSVAFAQSVDAPTRVIEFETTGADSV